MIVITGYEDFQYAKAAIRNQARNYLLKPVTQDELTETLSKIVQELDGIRNERDQQAMMQWRLSQYYKEMKEHFLVHLVKEEVERESLLRREPSGFNWMPGKIAKCDSLPLVRLSVNIRSRNVRQTKCGYLSKWSAEKQQRIQMGSITYFVMPTMRD